MKIILFSVSNIEYETTHEDAILDDNVPDNDIFPESNVESITAKTTTDSNKEYKTYICSHDQY